MTSRWLNAREWLEYERLTGLPHADFAAEALRELGEAEDTDEALQELHEAISTFDDTTTPDKALNIVLEDANRYRAVVTLLREAGIVDPEVWNLDVVPLLRMFLPC